MDATSERLWAPAPFERLRAARAIDPDQLQQATMSLLAGCPSSAWPYGCSTSINPWVVFLGVSPGTSPAAGDPNFVPRRGASPTAGCAPRDMVYSDSRGFFERLRGLTIALIRAEVGQAMDVDDALSLSGIMNLDSGASGDARNVTVDEAFARWSVDVAIRRLRPRYVVGAGLSGFLGKPEHAWLRELMSSYVGAAFLPGRAPASAPFESYTEKRYVFRAWPLRNGGMSPQHLIILPQHPSRAPMTSPAIWRDAVRECVAFARTL